MLPPGWAIGSAVAIYLGIHASNRCLEVVGRGEYTADYRTPFLLLMCVLASVYGACRLVAFHPLFRPAYREWLLTGPWELSRPVPLGPVHLVWQDVVVVAGLSLVAMLAVLLCGGPTLQAWQLTGNLRLTPRMFFSQRQQEYSQV